MKGKENPSSRTKTKKVAGYILTLLKFAVEHMETIIDVCHYIAEHHQWIADLFHHWVK